MPLNSPVLQDGDAGFVGYASRLNPLNLPAGVLQLSENMRLDRGVAVTRKGAKRMADDISPGQVPLTVPFNLSETPEDEDTNPRVRSSYSGGIFASAIMRSPDEINSQEIIVLAGSDRAYTYLTDNSVQNSAAWGDGVIDAGGGDELVTDTGEGILASNLPAELTFPTTPDETIDPTDSVTMLQAFDRLYIFREADTSVDGWETKYTSSAVGISVAGTTATVGVPSHGYPVGARVRIEGSAVAAFDGHEYDIVTVPSSDTFAVTVPSGTASPGAVANIKVRRVKPPIYWDANPQNNFVRAVAGVPDVGITYKRLRSAPWANYINNRLIVPDGRQNLMLSDILDPDVFDPYWQSFRVGVGGNDRVVAVHPWVDGNILVFCRKSIWLANVEQYPNPQGSGFTIETGINRLELLTDEIGCSARRTIQTAGSFIYFLSDAGVYRLDSQLDLKLRGNTKPLSDPISDQIANLNAEYVENSIGLFAENRYYLAVPLADSDGSNDGVFIFNQLNEQWETRDIYGFGVDNFIVANRESERRIFISNQAGKLMMLDELEAGDDSPDSDVNIVSPVQGRIKTRRYGFNTMTHKRYTRVITDAILPDGSKMFVSADTLNPDEELGSQYTLTGGKTIRAITMLNNQTGEAEDYHVKAPTRYRAHGMDVTIYTDGGRPEIRAIGVEAAGPSLPSTETRTVE